MISVYECRAHLSLNRISWNDVEVVLDSGDDSLAKEMYRVVSEKVKEILEDECSYLEDIVMDVITDIIERCRSNRSTVTRLSQILLMLVRKYMEKYENTNTVGLEDEYAITYDMESNVCMKDVILYVNERLRVLDSRYKKAVVGYYYCGKSLREIGEDIGVTPERIRQILSAARLKMSGRVYEDVRRGRSPVPDEWVRRGVMRRNRSLSVHGYYS